ncbi:MAG: extracellular solute-binding protein [Candidatus Bathyarchaeia archaeon]
MSSSSTTYQTYKLNFTGAVIADIFRRNITNWNDPRIAAINPTINLPSQTIYVVHRSDSSGTTKVFTSFLSDENAAWKNTYGASNTINWPEETDGGKGNSGVAVAVQQNQYSIGYVELSYAVQNNIPYGKVLNPANGQYVEPTFDTLKAAADSVAYTLPPGDQKTVH